MAGGICTARAHAAAAVAALCRERTAPDTAATVTVEIGPRVTMLAVSPATAADVQRIIRLLRTTRPERKTAMSPTQEPAAVPRISAALHDLLNNHHVDLDEAVARHFSDDYRQRTDGEWDDRAGFIDHMRHLRQVVAHADITVHDELESGRNYADRHSVTITKTDGATVTQEVYLFGRLAHDGRFAEVHEVTLMLHGNEADRNIGSAR